MGQAHTREVLSPYEVNTPLVGISFLSMVFNSVEKGYFRWSNFYGNMLLIVCTLTSTGCYARLHQPELGAKLGLVSAALFTFGPNVKMLYFNRFLPNGVRYGIGSFYLTYHSLALYRAKYSFEDALEDGDEDCF